MLRLHVNWFDYTILAIYFTLVITIGVIARRAVATSEDFLLSGRSLPAWVTGLAFISANLGRDRDPGHGRERRPVRPADRALLLDRRGPGHGVPRHRHDAVLLRVTGPQRAGVPAPAVQPGHAPVQRPDVRAGRGADRRREPVRPGPGHQRADRLADLAVDRRLGAVRAGLHHPRRAVRRDLQRGAAVLRDHRRAGPAGDHRAAQRRRLERPAGQDRSHQAGRQCLLHLERRRGRALDQPAGRLDRHRLRARLRPVVRLLDHELRRGPARPVGQGPVRGPADAADRGVPEDLHSRPDHHPRPDRAGRDPQAGHAQGPTYNDAIPR